MTEAVYHGRKATNRNLISGQKWEIEPLSIKASVELRPGETQPIQLLQVIDNLEFHVYV